MQNRTLLLAVAAISSACLVPVFAGCGSSSGGSSPDSGTPQDSGTPMDTGTTPQDSSAPSETGSADTGTTMHDGGDAAAMVNCTGGVAPPGTKILTSTSQTVQGVTSDNEIILYDPSAKALSYIPVAGGTATMIDAYDGTSGMAVESKVLYYYHGVTGTPATGALNVWTAAAGKQSLAVSAYAVAGVFPAVSSNGAFIAYTDNATAQSADVYVAGTDGSNPTKVVPAALVNANCQPFFSWAGTTLVVGSCTGGDGGAEQATITAFSGTGWTTTQTISNAAFFNFTISKDGTEVAFTTSGGQYVQAIGSAAQPTLIDALGFGAAEFSPDDSTLYYIHCTSQAACSTASSIYRSSITTPAPALVAAPFAGTYNGGVSPDGNWMYAYKSTDTTGDFTDLYLLPTAAGSTPIALVTTTTATFFSAPWTTDGMHAIYYGNVTAAGIGDFDTATLASGTMGTNIAHNSWLAGTLSTSKVTYNDNYVAGGPIYGYADIETIDLGASTPTPTKLVTGADADYYVTADLSTIVYSFSACPNLGTPGVYTVPAP